jgi:Flp pilus assembly pilin Flp
MIKPMIGKIDARRRHFKSKKGQALVEYALVLSLISVLAISALNALGVEIRGIYLSIDSVLSDAFASIK